ncbi:MAG: efflux RND transporter periplasmic adaptor subunit [Candidatus Omnitrophica bacterium]|nr:efflux RND transporter periplasmic adaptor subunit [Candidatus Omnitrophota bacterium]
MMIRLSGPNKHLLISTFCVVLSGTVLISAGCGKQGSGKKKGAPDGPLQSVRIMKASPAPPEVRSFPGRTVAADEATLSFQVKGTVKDIPVTVGQKVKKGDLIARLDAAYYRDALNSAKAALESLQAKFKDARLTFERNQQLWASKDIDAEEMDASRAKYRSLKKRVESAEAAVAEARDDLSHTVIYAPFDGSVADKHIQRHEVVLSGQPVADLTGVSGFRVKTNIPERYFLLKDRFRKYRCRFSSYPGKHVRAELVGIGEKALSPTKTYPLKVKIVNKEDINIYAGMEVEVLVTIAGTEEKKDVFVLPSSSVVSGKGGKTIVWTYGKKSGSVTSRPVELGRLAASGVEIVSGLKGGEYVVTAGGNMLREGQKVQPVADHLK